MPGDYIGPYSPEWYEENTQDVYEPPTVSKLGQILDTLQSLAQTTGETVVELYRPPSTTSSSTGNVNAQSSNPLAKTQKATAGWTISPSALIIGILATLIVAPLLLRRLGTLKG